MTAARMRWQGFAAAIAVLALAAATGVLSAGVDWIVRARTRLALERLLAGAGDADLPAARFSAIPPARAHASMRGPSRVSLRTSANAARVLAIAGESTSPDAIAARAAALVIRRDLPEAVALLETATASAPGEARLWSDLGAAYLEANERLRALVATDKALRIDPSSAAARENRTQILERLGLAPVVDENWTRQHSERGRCPPQQEALDAAAAAGDDATVARIVGDCPALSRSWGEGKYLAQWAETKSDRPLRAARAIGSVLRQRGETLLSDAVSTIDDAVARNDSARLATLVRAHLAYHHGRMAYAKREYAAAERELRAAADAFRLAQSPMEHVARAFIAAELIDRVEYGEAAGLLANVAAAARKRSGHRALLAHAGQLAAMCELSRGRWEEAARAAKESLAIYRELGEGMNAATSEMTLAAIFDLVGQRERGWEMRLRGFESTSASGAPDRLLIAVASATRAAMRAQDHDLALSLLDIEVALAPRAPSPLLEANLYTRRAEVQHARGAYGDRDASIVRARAAIASLTDERERRRLSADLDAAEASFLRTADPRRAIQLLGGAVQFCEETSSRFLLPTFLLQRARAYLAAGDRALARRDFAAAIDELEAQRGAIASLDLRSRMLDTATQLFEEAIALHVAEGDAEEAFRVAERARGRALLDVLEGRPEPVQSSAAIASRLAPDTLLVEYAVLRDALVIFAIRNDGMRMHRVAVSRDELMSRRDLAALLLGPLRDELATSRRLIVVPDGELQRVAFAALPWNGQYLVKTHGIAEAPSASRLVAAGEERRSGETSMLIVGNPAPDPQRDLEALPRVQREIAQIRALHRQTRVLEGPDATKQRFLDEAPRHDVIHFAGHGLSDEQSLTASLMLYGADGLVPLTTSDIAALRLERKPLVVLSACGTLRGRITGMEGMPSLARSFLAAGASAVVGTLTDIGDEHAAALVASFHRRIVQGAPPADALRDAQLEAIARGGAAADPKNWAPFVLYGATP